MTEKNIIKPKRRPLNFKGNTTNKMNKVGNENSIKNQISKTISELFKIILDEDI